MAVREVAAASRGAAQHELALGSANVDVATHLAAPIAAGHYFPAAMLGVIYEAFHGVDAPRIGHRPHRVAFLEPVAELDRFGIFGEARQETMVDRLLHVEPRR